MSKKIQDENGNTYVEIKPWYKKWWIWVLAVVVIIFLFGSLGGKNTKNSESKKNSGNNTTVEKTENQTTKNNEFSFGNDIFKTNKLSYKITKVTTMNGTDSNKKVLVLETDITNNTKKDVNINSDANAYEYIHAYQNTDKTKKNLLPGSLGLDGNGNSPEQSREDTMNSESLLAGKTVQGIVMFDLENNSTVTVTFDNAEFQTIATKKYNIQ